MYEGPRLDVVYDQDQAEARLLLLFSQKPLLSTSKDTYIVQKFHSLLSSGS